MKGFGIYVKNDLLEPKHYWGMRESIWLYLWLLDKMTSVSENGIGKILGGKPIKDTDFSEDVGCSTKTYHRWLKVLVKGKYINKKRTPYGLILTVNKAKKVFGQKGQIRPLSNREKGQKVTREGTVMSTLYAENVPSNKTRQLDKTYNNTRSQVKINKGLQSMKEIFESRRIK